MASFSVQPNMQVGPPDRPEEKTFFGKTGPGLFMRSFRQTTETRGEVNPAFDDDDDDDVDCDAGDRLSGTSCQSMDTSDDDSFPKRMSEDEEGEDGIEMKPVSNGRLPHQGDFKVEFEDITEHDKPPPSSAKKGVRPWDRFTQTSNDNVDANDIEFWDKVFLVTKIVVAVLLFFLTLGTAVISKTCLIVITANIFPSTDSNDSVMYNELKTVNGTLTYDHDTTNVQWIWALVMLAGAPYFFSTIKSLWRILFQGTGRKSPDLITIAVVLFIEAIHSVGLNIMMFVVLPNLDPLSGLMISLCVGVIPGIFKIVYPRKKKGTSIPTLTMYIVTAISILGACGQLAAIGLWFYHVFNTYNDRLVFKVCLIAAPIFTSVHWWENYVHEGNKTSFGIPHLARNMRRFRTKLMLFTSVWKMLLTVAIPTVVYAVSCQDGDQCLRALYYQTDSATLHSTIGHIELVTDKDFNHCYHHLPMIVAVIGVLSSVLCFKLAKISCKIMTQIVDYSFPFALSTPVTMIVVLFLYGGLLTVAPDDVSCALPFPKLANTAGEYFQSLMDDTENWFLYGAGLCGFLSLLLVTNHIWMPGKERLQGTDKLFVQPLYCGIFLDQSMMLNRRRIEKVDGNDVSKKKQTQMNLDDLEVDDINDKAVYRTPNTPMIYMCATMWHETENEMLQLLKSIFRMDEDQCTRRNAQFVINRRDPDYYEFEAHIFFDDAFEKHELNEYDYTINSYVKQLIKSVEVSGSSIHGASYKIHPPVKVATPYGGRLVWELPGQNKLIAHLKDKTFIRHRKRWSQVMYMYYFLGFELFNKNLKKRKVLQKRAQNTFLLALDGDVDFHPRAVLLLVDRMRKNPDVGAACGRIHPIGNGAMVWYQKFEYAVSHWLQKAAEDKFGCVLCSPGCFSLFRGWSLMDDNVMARYTTPPSEARHYVQYDQGEDRWLCTLLLQQGHRVEYCAASDALTYAPEGFNEFFNQRRRWAPSTMANIMDLLADWKNVTKKNPEITIAYIFYQGLLMVSSILTPGTIFLMILGAINLAYPTIDLWVALLLNVIPVALMILLCFKADGDTQLTYSAILSTLYSLVMMIVIVGLLRQAADYGFCSVTTMFLMFIAGVFIIAAFVHPQEFWCIIHGFLYFLAIPSMSMILMLYALSNLNNVSWGTRETKVPADASEAKREETSKFSGMLAFLNQCCPVLPILNKEDERMKVLLDRLDDIEQSVRDMSTTVGSSRASLSTGSIGRRSTSPYIAGGVDNGAPVMPYSDVSALMNGTGQRENPAYVAEKQKVRDRMVNPYWMTEDKDVRLFREGQKLNPEERTFWMELITEYLTPLEEDQAKKQQISEDLLELRNKVCLIFILINSLFIIIVFSLQQVVASGGSLSFPLFCASADKDGEYDSGQSVEPISVAFTLVFGLLLFVQFCCMLLHRMATLLHICAATEIFKTKRKIDLPGMNADGAATERDQTMSYQQVYQMVRELQKDQEDDSISMTSESSYAPSETDDDEDAALRKQQDRSRWRDIAKKRRQANGKTLGANFRRNFQRYQSFLRENEETEDFNEADVDKLQKETRFNRMGHKSIKLLVDMAKNPETKKSLVGKSVAGNRFKALVEKNRLNDMMKEREEGVDNMTSANGQDDTDTSHGQDGGPGQRKVSGLADIMRQVVQARRAEDLKEKALKEQRESENSADFQADTDGGTKNNIDRTQQGGNTATNVRADIHTEKKNGDSVNENIPDAYNQSTGVYNRRQRDCETSRANSSFYDFGNDNRHGNSSAINRSGFNITSPKADDSTVSDGYYFGSGNSHTQSGQRTVNEPECDYDDVANIDSDNDDRYATASGSIDVLF